jgi:hypothetical protein
MSERRPFEGERALRHFRTQAYATAMQPSHGLFDTSHWYYPADDAAYSQRARALLGEVGFPAERVYLVELLRIVAQTRPAWPDVEAVFGPEVVALLKQVCFPEQPLDADCGDYFLQEVEWYGQAGKEAQTLKVADLLAMFERDGVDLTFSAWWEKPALAMRQAQPQLRQRLLALLEVPDDPGLLEAPAR